MQVRRSNTEMYHEGERINAAMDPSKHDVPSPLETYKYFAGHVFFMSIALLKCEYNIYVVCTMANTDLFTRPIDV